MRFFLVLVFSFGVAWATEGVHYQATKGVTLLLNGKHLSQKGELANQTTLHLKGKGKVVFAYPCGAPKIVKVSGSTSVDVEHHCKDNSIASALVKNFFDTWFAEDEKIVIAASSRSSNAHPAHQYVMIDQSDAKIAIPIYDEDAEYKVVINGKDFNGAKFIKDGALIIEHSVLMKHSMIVVYEDDVKVFDFSLDLISKEQLNTIYPDDKLTLFEKVLLYAKEHKQELYVQNLDALLGDSQ